MLKKVEKAVQDEAPIEVEEVEDVAAPGTGDVEDDDLF